MPLSPFNETGLYYERSGAGEALVLVHGSWVDGRTWDAVGTVLARSFEVVTYDLRGHSRSVLSPASGSIHDDVADWLGSSRLGLQPAHVAGHQGGSIALRLAATRPELAPFRFTSRPCSTSSTTGISGAGRVRAVLAAVAEPSTPAITGCGSALLRPGRPCAWLGRIGPSRRAMLLANAGTYLEQCRDPDASASSSSLAASIPRWSPSAIGGLPCSGGSLTWSSRRFPAPTAG